MLNRRAFVRRSAAGAAVLLLPQATARAAVLREGRFRQGVLSGDPTPDGVTLLTLLDDAEGRGSVRLEVATDSAFRKVVARHRVVGVVVAVGEVGAGEAGEAHGLARVGGQRGLEAPDGAVPVARLEAVPVALVRVEPGHARLHRVPDGARGEDVAARDHLVEA